MLVELGGVCTMNRETKANYATFCFASIEETTGRQPVENYANLFRMGFSGDLCLNILRSFGFHTNSNFLNRPVTHLTVWADGFHNWEGSRS
jgi:hypothetical protein